MNKLQVRSSQNKQNKKVKFLLVVGANISVFEFPKILTKLSSNLPEVVGFHIGHVKAKYQDDRLTLGKEN